MTLPLIVPFLCPESHAYSQAQGTSGKCEGRFDLAALGLGLCVDELLISRLRPSLSFDEVPFPPNMSLLDDQESASPSAQIFPILHYLPPTLSYLTTYTISCFTSFTLIQNFALPSFYGLLEPFFSNDQTVPGGTHR